MAEARAGTPAKPKGAGSMVTLEDIVNGRLTLIALRNDLHTQIAGLQSQLAIAEHQLQQADDLLRRADQKMATQHPAAYASLTGAAKAPRIVPSARVRTGGTSRSTGDRR
jgi:hypothetical protein